MILLQGLAVFEEDQRWVTVDFVSSTQTLVLIAVNLCNFDVLLVSEFAAEQFPLRRQSSAVTTPGGEKLDERQFSFLHLRTVIAVDHAHLDDRLGISAGDALTRRHGGGGRGG